MRKKSNFLIFLKNILTSGIALMVMHRGVCAVLVSGKPEETRIDNQSRISFIESTEASNEFTDTILSSQQIKLKEIRKLARAAGHDNPENITEFSTGICYQHGCLDAAKEYFTSMDLSKDPCAEWQKFTCEWRTLFSKTSLDQMSVVTLNSEQRVHEILEDTRNESPTIKSAQEYFRACLAWFQESERVNHVANYLQSFGNWPMLNGLDYKGDWTKLLAEIIRITPDNVSPFLFKFEAVAVKENKVVLEVGVGSSWLEVETDDIHDIIRTIQSKLKDHNTDNKIVEEIREMQKCMRSLSVAKYTEDVDSKPALVTLGSLSEEIPTSKQSILKLLQSVFHKTDLKISAETEVLINTKNMIEYFKVIDSVSERALVNILFLQLAIVLLGDTTDFIERAGFLYLENYKRLHSGSIHQCLVETSDLFNFALSEEYLKRFHFPSSSIEMLVNITKHLQIGFLKTLNSLKWMQDSSKSLLRERVDTMKPLIGYPEWILDPSQLEIYYSNLEPAGKTPETMSYLKFRNQVKGWLNGKLWTMKLNDDPVNGWNYRQRNGFIGDTQVEYIPLMNQLRVPLGALQSPLYKEDFPGFMNFGGIGSVIARELARIIIPLDLNEATDSATQWWSNEQSYRSYIDWSQRLQAEWDDDDADLNDKIINVISYHITVNGYAEWLKSLNKDGLEEVKLPGLTEQRPEILLLIKYTNVFCEDDYIKSLRKEWKHHSLHNAYSSIPLTQTNHFMQLFHCDSNPKTSAFDLQ